MGYYLTHRLSPNLFLPSVQRPSLRQTSDSMQCICSVGPQNSTGTPLYELFIIVHLPSFLHFSPHFLAVLSASLFVFSISLFCSTAFGLKQTLSELSHLKPLSQSDDLAQMCWQVLVTGSQANSLPQFPLYGHGLPFLEQPRAIKDSANINQIRIRPPRVDWSRYKTKPDFNIENMRLDTSTQLLLSGRKMTDLRTSTN